MREQTVRALSGIIQAKPSEASLENPLCEMVITKGGTATVFPSKLGAIAQLAKYSAGTSQKSMSIAPATNSRSCSRG
jgi:hypothetical protein